MIEQLKTIREALEIANLGLEDSVATQQALAALTQLEAMVGEQKPVACVGSYWNDGKGFDLCDFSGNRPAPGAKLYAAPVAQQPQALTRDRVRDIFMAHGFTVKDGQTDLKEYVYEAAAALLAAAQQPQAIPRGWTIVPIKLTEEMLRAPDYRRLVAASAGETERRYLGRQRDWEAMLIEAPKPPTQQPQADEATSAGLEASISILSQLVDEQRQLLAEVDAVFGVDAHGIVLEDGDSELIDRVRAHLAATSEAKQPQAEAVSDDLRDRLVAIGQAIADQDDRAAQAMIREILAAPQQTEVAHPVVKPDTLVNRGALQMALNVLRRAGKDEVADELEKTIQQPQAEAAPNTLQKAEAHLLNLIGEYWGLAYAEGEEGRNHDTEDGAAQRTHAAIAKAVKDLIAAASSTPQQAEAVPPGYVLVHSAVLRKLGIDDAVIEAIAQQKGGV